MDVWLIIHGDDGQLHCWQLGDPEADRTAELVTRARIAAGVPAADYVASRVMLSQGEPHPRTLAKATVHPVADLDRLTVAVVDAYRTAQADATRQARLDEAQTVVNLLPEADRTTLRTRLGWSAAPKPVDGRA
jgi:hypothetical protein